MAFHKFNHPLTARIDCQPVRNRGDRSLGRNGGKKIFACSTGSAVMTELEDVAFQHLCIVLSHEVFFAFKTAVTSKQHGECTIFELEYYGLIVQKVVLDRPVAGGQHLSGHIFAQKQYIAIFQVAQRYGALFAQRNNIFLIFDG